MNDGPRNRHRRSGGSSSRRHLSPWTSIGIVAAAALLLPTHLARAAHVPFGYQSDSTHSIEYRNYVPNTDPGGGSAALPVDPSTYPGAVRYDPLHHALYVAGATYASQVFDGVDVYDLKHEQGQLEDGNEKNDGYWWNDFVTGLKPHLEDPGVPDHEPARGDCFYAIFGLPNGDDPAWPPEQNDVKLVHSRRFGTEVAPEACSAIDVLPTSLHEDMPGGYVHEFEMAMQQQPQQEEESTNNSNQGEEPQILYPAVDFDGPPAGPPVGTPADDFKVGGPLGPPVDPMEAPPTPVWKEHGPPIDWHGPPTDGAPFTMYPTYPPTVTRAPSSPVESPAEPVATEPSFSPTTHILAAADEPSAGPTTLFPTLSPTVTFAPSAPADTPSVMTKTEPSPAEPSALLYNTGPQPAPSDMGTEGMADVGGTGAMYDTDEPSGSESPSPPAPVPDAAGFIPDGNGMGGRRNRGLRVPVPAPGQRPAQRGLVPANDQPTNEVRTRSVRHIMAGHVESPDEDKGYVVGSLDPSIHDPAKVYAFAQQVDVRLPAGDLERSEVQSNTEDLAAGYVGGQTYNLHTEGADEDAFAMQNGIGVSTTASQSQLEKVVTSGVESRALLNDGLPIGLLSAYPAALAADATSKADYYVLMMVSKGDAANPAAAGARGGDRNSDPTAGPGAWGDPRLRSADWNFPNYGDRFRMVVKKVTIEGDLPEEELTAVDLTLAGSSYQGPRIAMRQAWAQEFETDRGEDVRPGGMLFAPSGDPGGKGDVLIVAGTTAGQGDAFGLTEGDRDDLDGFVTKIEADEGEFAGREKFNFATDTFENTFSKRIRSLPGKDEVAAGVCARPLRAIGTQEPTTHVYVVGSTSGLVEGADPFNQRSLQFLQDHPGKAGEVPTEAFLTKVDIATMNVVWTQQVGAFVPGEAARGSAHGYGCTVTNDGKNVYLAGLVSANGIATDFSAEDVGSSDKNAEGGTDIFVASYETSDGARNYVRQFGSTRDDVPSRGDAVTSDRFGNVVVTGSTRGSLMRRRGADEYRYGPGKNEAAADVFVVSLERATGKFPAVQHDGVDARSDPRPAMEFVGEEEKEETRNVAGRVVGVAIICVCSVGVAAAIYFLAVQRLKARKSEERAIVDSNTNLHDTGHGSNPGTRSRNWRTWGVPRRRSTMEDIGNLNIMVEVRNSASGGWHGVYDDEQLQAIDFGKPSNGIISRSNSRGNISTTSGSNSISNSSNLDGSDSSRGVVERNLFMSSINQCYAVDDGLREIEDGLNENYAIGPLDDVSDEDLIRAYNEAMALDIEPENEDVQFTMAGLGSGSIPEYSDYESDNYSDHQIT